MNRSHHIWENISWQRLFKLIQLQRFCLLFFMYVSFRDVVVFLVTGKLFTFSPSLQGVKLQNKSLCVSHCGWNLVIPKFDQITAFYVLSSCSLPRISCVAETSIMREWRPHNKWILNTDLVHRVAAAEREKQAQQRLVISAEFSRISELRSVHVMDFNARPDFGWKSDYGRVDEGWLQD